MEARKYLPLVIAAVGAACGADSDDVARADAIHERLERAGEDLPSAKRVLEQALVEAGREERAANCV